MLNLYEYWRSVLLQQQDKIIEFFERDATVQWPCTNELFTVDEFIRANCEYPGDWDGEIEKIYNLGNEIVTITHVYTVDKSVSFHVTSFFEVKEDKINSIIEYWAEDELPPKWRIDMNIGTPFKM